MKFIIDNQLPLALAKWLQSRGEDAVHVIEREQAKADDWCIWSDAIREGRIVVSKDEDFVILASRRGDPGRLLWLRVGNCRTDDLIRRFETSWDRVLEAFQSGQRVVEFR